MTANVRSVSLPGVIDRLGIVIFGDVVASRIDAPAASAWLRRLRDALDTRYGIDRLAPFGFTQGDELQGLIGIDADPLDAVLFASLHEDARPMRWAIAAGEIEPGPGPATERTGPAFLVAREALERASTGRDRLVVAAGDARADDLLAEVAPVLARLLDELTVRQRTIGRLLIVEGLRQADAADRLRVTRATVSVVANRARVREIARLANAIRTLLADGIEQAWLGSPVAGRGAGR